MQLTHVLEPIFMLVSSLLTVFEVLAPVIGQLLQMITSLIDIAIMPFMGIIQLLSALFIQIYNYVLRPIFWAIQNFVAVIYNGIATVFNGLADAVNWIPGVNIRRMSKMDFQDFDDMYISENSLETQLSENGGQYSNPGASSNASYTAARDIYVTISYNNSYVNGDAREIALNLRQEIRAAEALGL
jgi:hypothetical protein